MEKWTLKPFEYHDFLKNSRSLAEKYPFLSVNCLTKSAWGREILSFTVGVAEEYVLLLGGIDAEDDFSSSVLFGFLEELCLALRNNLSLEGLRVRRALTGRAVIIVPCLNPDKGTLPDIVPLLKSIPIRHVAIIAGGRGQILLGPAPKERSVRMAEILSSSTGYSYYISYEENALSSSFEKEAVPVLKIESDNSACLLSIYRELREALMLLSIM